MKPVRYTAALYLKLELNTRLAIEEIAMRERTSLGAAARGLIEAGLTAKGIDMGSA